MNERVDRVIAKAAYKAANEFKQLISDMCGKEYYERQENASLKKALETMPKKRRNFS